jgi:hypothetical protein
MNDAKYIGSALGYQATGIPTATDAEHLKQQAA